MSSPRLRRLQSDFESVKTEFSGNPHVVVDHERTVPPQVYYVTYRLPGLKLQGTNPVESREHKVGRTYPPVGGAAPTPGATGVAAKTMGRLRGLLPTGMVQMLTAGLLGAFAAWGANELLYDFSKQLFTGNIVLQVAVWGAMVAAVMGFFFGPVQDFLNRHYGRAALSGLKWMGGAALGGFIGSGLGQYVYGTLGGGGPDLSLTAQVLARTLGWGLFGLGCGLGHGGMTWNRKRFVNGLLGGLIGGVAGGLLFDFVAMLNAAREGAASRLVGFIALGCVILFETLSRPPHSHVFKGLQVLLPDRSLQKIRAALEQALEKPRRLQLTYGSRRHDQRGGNNRLVRLLLYPLGLVCDRGTGFWYLVGTRKIKNRPLQTLFLRLDRIRELEHLDSFRYPLDFNLHQFMKPYWGMQPDRPTPVKVRFYNEAQVIFKARRELEHRCPPGTLEQEPGGSLLYTGEVVGMDVFRAWLRGFGSSVEVLEPANLRQKMIETARKLYHLHAGKTGQ